MARLIGTGFEIPSVATPENYEGINISSFAVTNVTSPVHGGARAWHVHGDFSNSRWAYHETPTGEVIFAREYIRFVAFPSVDTYVFGFLQGGTNNKISLKVTTTGVIKLWNFEDNVQIGSDSAALSLDTWYRWEIKLDTTTLSASVCEAKIDGTTFATGTANLSAAVNMIFFGVRSVNTTVNYYIDDIAVNDNTGSFENSWPGDGKIIRQLVNGAGDASEWATRVGGTAGAANNYTRVDEDVPDDATSYNASNLLLAEDMHNCTPSGLDTNAVIKVIQLNCRHTNPDLADPVSGFNLQLVKESGGTKQTGSAIIPNIGSQVWRTPERHTLTSHNDPDGNPWTPTTLDSMQIGYINTLIGILPVAVTAVWAMVEYTDAPPPPPTFWDIKVETAMIYGK